MLYYEVYVASQRFHGTAALTYQSEKEMERGQVVSVPLQNESVMGIVKTVVKKPKFVTKEISTSLDVVVPETTFGMIEWLKEYYPSSLGSLLQSYLPSSLAQKSRLKQPDTVTTTDAENGIIKNRTVETKKLPQLTPMQKAAVVEINTQAPKPVLLHGITASGKTRVYLELALQQVKNGKSVLVMTPEIGLTPQLVDQFAETFPGRVETVHSTLTPAEKRDVWLRIARSSQTHSQPIIVIGPRSALFTPIRNLGLIVIDEAHDNAYKQEQAPYYQATRVAATLAKLSDAQLVLGTATPLVDDYYAFKEKGLTIVELSQLAQQVQQQSDDIHKGLGKSAPAQDTKTTIVNLRERQHFTRSAWLSTPLLENIIHAISKNEQSLVFLNRRGTARLVMCSSCGWQALCPRCDLPLTYHGDSHQMQCHTCGFSQRAATSCPTCQSGDITFRSVGTKSIVAELERLFPKARIARFDSDNKKDDRMEANYQSVADGDVDILVGTQVLTKGLDLPKLSVVGVVVADTGLYFPDYTAEEKTFQMLTQVLGRVGRGHRAGSVIVQTYSPDNPTIQQAIKRDYAGFYEAQLHERELYHFPPFFFVLKLRCSRKSSASAEQAAHKLAQSLLKQKLPIELSGPSTSFIEKSNNVYHWQIVVKAKQRTVLLEIIQQLPSNWSYDIDPTNLL